MWRFIIPLILVLPQEVLGQYFFRLKADFTVKEKSYDDVYRLVVGSVYYDLYHRKIVYDVQFPEKEVWVLSDTTIYLFKEGVLKERKKALMYPEFSVFHLALQGGLRDYGLKDHPVIKVKDIRKEGRNVIRTWKPTAEHRDNVGDIVMSSKDHRLEAILFYNPQQRLMSRQFFNEYALVRGIEFPMEIVQFLYANPETRPQDPDAEMLVKTQYRNIQLNRSDEEYMYNYPVPVD